MPPVLTSFAWWSSTAAYSPNSFNSNMEIHISILRVTSFHLQDTSQQTITSSPRDIISNKAPFAEHLLCGRYCAFMSHRLFSYLTSKTTLWYRDFLLILWRYNLHSVKCPDLKHRVQRGLRNAYACITHPTINSESLLMPPSHSTPWPWQEPRNLTD